MIHPDKLINFAVFADADELLGIVDASLPNMTPLKETTKGAGILGEYEVGVPGHYSSMKCSFTWRHATAAASRLAHPEGMLLTLRAAMQGIDSATYAPTKIPVVVTIRPFASDMSFGNFDPATAMGTTTEIECAYYKYTYNGEIVHEIDKLNFKAIVGGVDVMSEINAILGR